MRASLRSLTIALVLVPFGAPSSSPAARPVPRVTAAAGADITVRVREYRVTDASADMVAAFDAAEGADAARVFAGIDPRVDVEVRVTPGETVSVSRDRVQGTVRVEVDDAGQLAVTLALERFFEGSALLLRPCEPHALSRSKARVQGRTQLSLRTVEVTDGSC